MYAAETLLGPEQIASWALQLLRAASVASLQAWSFTGTGCHTVRPMFGVLAQKQGCICSLRHRDVVRHHWSPQRGCLSSSRSSRPGRQRWHTPQAAFICSASSAPAAEAIPLQDAEGKRARFPEAAGVYAVYSEDGRLQYVGMSRKVWFWWLRASSTATPCTACQHENQEHFMSTVQTHTTTIVVQQL